MNHNRTALTVWTLVVLIAVAYCHLAAVQDITIPQYKHCVKMAGANTFSWVIANGIFYGHVIGKGSDNGWTAVGFSSGMYDLCYVVLRFY
jgi:hypothetical protein